MGGSGGSGGFGGGGIFGGGSPQEIADKLREAEASTATDAFITEVNELLATILADANDRDTAANAKYLEEIRIALESGTDGVVDLYFGGSVSKHTYVDGISDVDALVVLDEHKLGLKDPATICVEILDRLRQALTHAVEADGFAITIHFPECPVQIVPVLRRGADYLLPSSDLSSWSRTRPKAFTDLLTTTNKTCNGKLVPTIKLAKILMSSLPEGRRPSGYHLENLAVNAFSEYDGAKTPRAMLHHFFAQAPALIRSPIIDRSGQSAHVADELGSSDSTARLIVADAVDRIGRRLRNADASGNIGHWRSLFGVSD